jgi:hypothetical protein
MQRKRTLSFSIQKSHEILNRGEFSLLCNWRRLYTAAEIGVEKGIFAKKFLSRWRGHTYYAVDDYASYPEMPYGRFCDRQAALANLQDFSHIVKFIPMQSSAFASDFSQTEIGKWQNHELNFVYLDGDHTYSGVAADMDAWWPVVSADGLLAGHDFEDAHPGVKQAVSEFADKNNLDVFVTHETDSPPSWYIYKSGLPGPDWKRIAC